MRTPRAAFARIALLAFLGGILAVLAVPAAAQQTGEDEEGTAFPYEDYAAVLEGYVDADGMVDYRGLKANRSRLDAFIRSLGRLSRAEYGRWSGKEQIAFWINAYNAITLKEIIDHYPIEPTWPAKLVYPDNSIRQIKGVWDELETRVMGRDMTLEGIEHETLRVDFDEPRIHVALVCAAMGCPPLLNEPYTGDQLDEQFASRTRELLSDRKKFRIDRRKSVVYLSPIFDWFGEDFVSQYGIDSGFRGHNDEERAVLNFLAGHLSEANARYLRTAKYKLKYLDYDWSLNEQK